MAFKERNMVIVFDETTNYDPILLSNTPKRHLETSAANIWDLVQSDQWNLLVFANFFTVSAHYAQTE